MTIIIYHIKFILTFEIQLLTKGNLKYYGYYHDIYFNDTMGIILIEARRSPFDLPFVEL